VVNRARRKVRQLLFQKTKTYLQTIFVLSWTFSRIAEMRTKTFLLWSRRGLHIMSPLTGIKATNPLRNLVQLPVKAGNLPDSQCP